MHLKHIIFICQLTVLVYGDVLLDYAERSLEQLPNWVRDELDDTFAMEADFSFPRRDGFIEYNLQEWNITVSNMKSIRLLEKPVISGSLFLSDLTIDLKITADLKLSGDYNASYGYLFPFVENIPYNCTGLWTADATVISDQTYYVYMNASINGSMSLVSQYQDWSNYKVETAISNMDFTIFLEDHVEQWYYPIMKDGFEKDLEERARFNFAHNPLDVFGGFFEKYFKNINYFDIIERKT